MNKARLVLKKLQVTEKGTGLQAQNKYLFEVDPNANAAKTDNRIRTLDIATSGDGGDAS